MIAGIFDDCHQSDNHFPLIVTRCHLDTRNTHNKPINEKEKWPASMTTVLTFENIDANTGRIRFVLSMSGYSRGYRNDDRLNVIPTNLTTLNPILMFILILISIITGILQKSVILELVKNLKQTRWLRQKANPYTLRAQSPIFSMGHNKYI